MIRAVVFDYDGTLADSNAIKRDAYARIFLDAVGDEVEQAAVHAVVESVVAARPKDDRCGVIGGVLDAFAAAGFGPQHDSAARAAAVTDYAMRYNRICEDGAATCPEMPGAKVMLARLAKDRSLHVNTGTPVESITRVLRRRGWDRFFTSVYGAEDGKAKALHHIMAERDLTPNEIVMVGDDEADLEGACAVGCRMIGYANSTSQLRSAPDHIIERLDALDAVLASWDRATADPELVKEA